MSLNKAIYLLCLVFQFVELVVIKVEQGFLQGAVLERSTGGRPYYSFKGIPYAAPPVGDLRFKAPQPPFAWYGVRNATEHGAICPQINTQTGKYVPGNEDCLFINVYTPNIYPDKQLPVMFYIFGGALVSGSGNDADYGPDFLIDNDVVLVTFNYRVGVLGFLALEIIEAPGNAALKDQVAALKWTKKNIASFGGDPDNITIFGHSTGSNSVSLHILSPMSKGLFQRAIMMSGVFLNDLAQPFEPQKRIFKLCQQLGFRTRNSYEALKFLQTVPVETLITTQPILLYIEELNGNVSTFRPFTPVVEKYFGVEQFMIEDPLKLLKQGKVNVNELMIGHTEQEGLYASYKAQDMILDLYPRHRSMFVPLKIVRARNPRQYLPLSGQIYDHYFGNKALTLRTMYQFINFFSYYKYVYDIYRYAFMWPACKKIYFYRFHCFSERNVYGKYGELYGFKNTTTHMDDLMYVFDGKKYNLTIDKGSESYKMIRQTTKLFTNFAKYGNPTPDKSLAVIWPEFSKQSSSFLEIDSVLTVTYNDKLPEITFWRSIFESVCCSFD